MSNKRSLAAVAAALAAGGGLSLALISSPSDALTVQINPSDSRQIAAETGEPVSVIGLADGTRVPMTQADLEQAKGLEGQLKSADDPTQFEGATQALDLLLNGTEVYSTTSNMLTLTPKEDSSYGDRGVSLYLVADDPTEQITPFCAAYINDFQDKTAAFVAGSMVGPASSLDDELEPGGAKSDKASIACLRTDDPNVSVVIIQDKTASADTVAEVATDVEVTN